MNVIVPENSSHKFTKLDNCKNSIFLAGPCPRDDYNDDWRNEAIEILRKLKFKGDVLNPTNKYYDEKDKDHLTKQTAWEVEAMHKASAIVFWIERSEEHPAYTTNIEFGEWVGRNRTYCGWTNKAIKNNYLNIRLNMCNKKRYTTLESMLEAVVKDLDAEPKNWFLSDTHFSQQRTLELSKRPFNTVEEMDLEMLSNWNKTVSINDTVYFLGDFGESFDYLNLLNFKKLNFVLGNYEKLNADKKDIKAKSVKALEQIPNVKVFDRYECKLELSDGKIVTMIHEPVNPDTTEDVLWQPNPNQLYLYGHIHGRTFYKLNGTDVGVDIHQFAPISEEEIIWRLNAIHYLDGNVWENECL